MEKLFFYGSVIGIGIGLFFLIYSNATAFRKSKALLFLNLFVLFFTLHSIQQLFADANLFVFPLFDRKLILPFYALVIPCFYTFITHYIQAEDKLFSFVKEAGFLFLFQIAARLCFYFIFNTQNYAQVLSYYIQIEEIINLSFTIVLFFKLVNLFVKQTKLIDVISSYDNMKWLKNFLFLGFLIIILWSLAVVFNLNKTAHPNLIIYYPLRFSSTMIIVWVSYNGFFRLNLITERVQLRKIISNERPLFLQKTDCTDGVFQKIESHLNTTQHFLNPNYDVSKLGKEINVSDRTIAKAITTRTNKNFTEYINFLRIKKAIEILKSTDFDHYTIVSVGFECGFNSKSTFYREFLKVTGTNPTAFRLSI